MSDEQTVIDRALGISEGRLAALEQIDRVTGRVPEVIAVGALAMSIVAERIKVDMTAPAVVTMLAALMVLAFNVWISRLISAGIRKHGELICKSLALSLRNGECDPQREASEKEATR